jgi:hypothetical protein
MLPSPSDVSLAPVLGGTGRLSASDAVHEWHDLAPGILRQRLVIEGVPTRPIGGVQVRRYLSALTRVVDMVPLMEPVTHRSDRFGWAGWIHWETSGAHFYAWERPQLFFSVDIYTCKAFEVERAVSFTRDFLHASTLVAKAL